MTDREDELGRILSTLLREETEAMQVDTNGAVERLERELSQPNQRRRFTVAAGVVAAAMVAGLVLWNQPDDRPAPAPSDRGNPTNGSSAPYFLDLSSGEKTPLPEALLPDPASERDPIYSPDATLMALHCPDGVCTDGEGLEIAHADGTTTVVPIRSGFTATTLAWSRDGTQLVYRLHLGGLLGDLYVYDLSQGRSTKVTDFEFGNAHWVDLRADFSPDGETVVFHRPRDASPTSKLDVWTVPATGGQPTLVRRNAAQPKYLTDGRIAFVQPGSNSLLGRVIAIATTTGPPQTLVELPQEVVDWQPSPNGTRALLSLDDHRGLVEIATGEMSDLGDVNGQWAGNDTLLVDPPTS